MISTFVNNIVFICSFIYITVYLICKALTCFVLNRNMGSLNAFSIFVEYFKIIEAFHLVLF